MELSALAPKEVWKHFFAICAIPHPSHHEEALARALETWAKDRGLRPRRDDIGNLIFSKAATPGKENSPGIILQCHLDMVPQASGTSAHDFTRDAIRPRPDPDDGDWMMATGTTLGADNGIGMAMALAAMEDETLAHGPLECVFTVNEEDGMSGAKGLQPGLLKGTVLLNLDSENEREFTIGCAGSIRSVTRLSHPAEATPASYAWYELRLSGLLGGHSGMDIDKGRANACLALARILDKAGQAPCLVSLQGGTASNAIPREAEAVVGVSEQNKSAFIQALDREALALKAELGPADPGLRLDINPAAGVPMALNPVASRHFLTLLAGLPNGLYAMESDMPALVRSSSNLGTLKAGVSEHGFTAEILIMVRSSSDGEKEAYASAAERRLAGAEAAGWTVRIERPSTTSAWSPDASSKLLALCKKVYREERGEEPAVLSTHGGLECGIFRPRFPAWDMISLGPTIRNPHSPDERLHIASVGRSYAFLKRLIAAI
jgi:dipeptidase D